MGPRIALLGFSIECNRFAPVATEADFASRTLLSGQAMLDEARAPAPRMLGELPGFLADMDAAGPWQPVPILLAMAEPNGPVDQSFFDRLMRQWESGLRAAGALDGVYCVLHGAGLTTGTRGPGAAPTADLVAREPVAHPPAGHHPAGLAPIGHDPAEQDPDGHDPEGALLHLVRGIVGDAIPVVATYDLHANVSAADVTLLNAFIGYRTNPHLDMRARGAEAAGLMRRLLSGTRTSLAHIRLPIVPPTVSQLTGTDAPNRPYGELIDLGQQRMGEPRYRGRVLNVSVMGGFAFADTPFNGLTVVVTATDRPAADDLARELAEAAWARRERFRPTLTSLEEATRLASAVAAEAVPRDAEETVAAGRTASVTRSARDVVQSPSHALAFADVADNPGGGGRGTTMWILEAFHRAGVRDALVGVIHDPALAAEAHRHGEGGQFIARFNRDGGDTFSKPFAAPAEVCRLLSGAVRGRRGIYADNTLELGQAAALDLDGIIVVVVSNRYQCADPVFFEAFGLNIAAARVVVVKSRGHFRGGFDEFFRHEDIIEVDAPGLTSPILSRFDWRYMPRPVLPIDATATWTPPT